MTHSRIRSIVFGLALVATVFTTVSCASGSPAGGVAEPAGFVAESSATPTATATPKPVILVKNVDVSEPIPFGAVSVDDGNLDVGQSAITTNGSNGTKTTTWAVTTVDGVETGRTVVSSVMSVAPVDQVTSVGTRVPPPPPAPEPAPIADGGGCDSNYSGPCVPIASDVDCAGGSGNGPAYVSGPVYVVGADIYDLDRDGDGVACDK
ncbi:G5 domain-containing protein [Agreia sp. VKM Ac-1783]|uniref:G5 domain-containing protein n=1 Tax=Agreia sp. VKM Ac-1783 TaxID=1938889 RepID=UPI000A2AD1B6|nr:G5 domain-containing protein [Agreia sp. VKM Ac-1783]SMQ71135.1 G5 domain-containing protein [Agreia sp. VKM Ac-1783]